MSPEELRRLTDLLGAARRVAELHPAEWISGSDDGMEPGYYQCHYCGEKEYNTPEMETLGIAMMNWHNENPSPVLVDQPIKRRHVAHDVRDGLLPEEALSEWDRENQHLHNSFNQKMGAWRRLYSAQYDEVWGDPNQHPGTAIDHKEGCRWVELKKALEAFPVLEK